MARSTTSAREIGGPKSCFSEKSTAQKIVSRLFQNAIAISEWNAATVPPLTGVINQNTSLESKHYENVMKWTHFRGLPEKGGSKTTDRINAC